MDVRIEAASMAADVEIIEPTVEVMVVVSVNKAFAPKVRVASFSCPSMGSHSISAVAPDTNFEGGLALAAA